MIEKQGLQHDPSADNIKIDDFMASPITFKRKAVVGSVVTATEEDINYQGMTAYAIHGDANAYAKDVKIASYMSADTVTVKADGSTILNVYFTRDHFTYVFDGFNSFMRFGDTGDWLEPEDAVQLYFKYNTIPEGISGTREGEYWSEIIMHDVHYGENVTDRWPDVMVGTFYIKDDSGSFVTLAEADIQISLGITQGALTFDGWRGIMGEAGQFINTSAQSGISITGRVLCNFNRDGKTDGKWRGCLMVHQYRAKYLSIVEKIVIPADAPRNTTGAAFEADINDYPRYGTIERENQSQLFVNWKTGPKSGDPWKSYVLQKEGDFDPNEEYWLNLNGTTEKYMPAGYNWYVSKVTGFEYQAAKTLDIYNAQLMSSSNPYSAVYRTLCPCYKNSCHFPWAFGDGKALETDDTIPHVRTGNNVTFFGEGTRLMPYLYERLDYELNFITVLGDDTMVDTYMVPYEADLSWWEPIIAEDQKVVQIDDVRYTFAGWYYDEEYTKSVDWENDRMPAEGFSVYARWDSQTINITYDLNYEGAPEPITYTMFSGTYMATQAGFNAVPVREGYKFLGWFYDRVAQDDNKFDAEQKIGDSLDKTTVYAAWEKITTGYTVRYLLAGTKTVVLHEQKVVNGLDVGQEITEDYIRIPGYRPDKLEDVIILKKNPEENIIIFYYEDLEGGQYQVIHRYTDAEGNEIQIEEPIVETSKERVVEYPGHEEIPDNYFPTVVVESKLLLANAEDGTMPEHNKIYFYYEPYPVAKYIVHHYYQTDLEQTEYTMYPEKEAAMENSDPVRKGYSYIAKRKIETGYNIEKVFVEEESQVTNRNLYLTPTAEQMNKEIHIHMYYSLITTTVTVEKEWRDNGNADGNRPETLQVQLMADGEAFGDPVTLTAADAWTHTWEDLVAYKEGEPIKFTVEEVVPAAYKQVYVDNPEPGDVTNGYKVVLTNEPLKATKDAQVTSWDERTYTITITASAPAGTTPFTDVTIKDYIDPRFEVVETDATVGEDENGTYVEWNGQTVNPMTGENTNDGWIGTILVKAKDVYIGGNDVTTNGECSITVDSKVFYLESPTVNVKMDFNVGKEEHWIYKGNTVGEELFSDDVIKQITTADLEKYTILDDVEKAEDGSWYTVEWYADSECTDKVTVEEIRSTAEDAVYYAKVTVTPKVLEPTAASLANTTDAAGTHKVDPVSKFGTYTVHMIKGELQIVKKLEYASDEDQTFTFTVTKDGDVYETVTITVPAGSLESEAVKLSDLAEGTYVVTEDSSEDFELTGIAVDEDTDCYNEENETNAVFRMGYDKNDKHVIKDGKLQEDAYITEAESDSVTVIKGVWGSVAFSNRETHVWQIIKKGAQDQSYLPGAKFKLEGQSASGESVTYYGTTEDQDGEANEEDGLIKWYTDDDYAERVTHVPNGRYVFSEIEAPTGYYLSDETWTMVVKNGKVTAINGNGTEISGESDDSGTQTMVTFYFYNDLLISLPDAGGEGVYWYTISGMLLMMAAALIWYRNKNKGVQGRQ